MADIVVLPAELWPFPLESGLEGGDIGVGLCCGRFVSSGVKFFEAVTACFIHCNRLYYF